jgi:16S rRNA (cytidine1402-2'-O)-methyltransferase
MKRSRPSRSGGDPMSERISVGARGDDAGVLFVVATPIGNPDDLGARARRVLADADRIACEDTRRTGQLLAAHGIKTPMLSFFEHNEERRTPDLIERLRRGERIALVSDAGTPGISDPGYRLVRGALDAGIRVSAIPGPSAVIAALSIAGLPTNRFAFEGFVPDRAGARQRLLESLVHERRTIVFFETARRLEPTLDEMAATLGADRPAAVVREITKTYEETVRGTLGELALRFHAAPALGEITIVVGGATAHPARTETPLAREIMELLLSEGLSVRQASSLVEKLSGQPHREIYQMALRVRETLTTQGVAKTRKTASSRDVDEPND